MTGLRVPPETNCIEVVIPSIRPAGARSVIADLHREGLGGRVLVVDDSPPDSHPHGPIDGARKLRSFGGGPGYARNVGARAVRAEWILLLDDDVVIPPGFGDKVRATLARVPSSVGIIECPIRPSGTVRRPYWANRVVSSRLPGGFLTACLIVRTEAYLKVGGIVAASRRDHREDTDFALRVLAAGWTSVWDADLVVNHPLEEVTLRRFLQTAFLLRHNPTFKHRHPGHLASTGERVRIGPLRVGAVRRRAPGWCVGMSIVALALRRPALALVPLYGLGVILNAAHVRHLKAVDPHTAWWRIADPRECLGQAAWGLCAAAATLSGLIETTLYTDGTWRGARGMPPATATSSTLVD